MDETTVTSLVERSQKPVFGFVLCLSCAGRQEAFELAVDSLTSALRSFSLVPAASEFLRALFKTAIQKCRDFPAPTGPDLSGEQMSRLIKKAMFSLSFEQKCLLLLRDQQHFTYEDMAVILDKDLKEVRSQVLVARDTLRLQTESLLA